MNILTRYNERRLCTKDTISPKQDTTRPAYEIVGKENRAKKTMTYSMRHTRFGLVTKMVVS